MQAYGERNGLQDLMEIMLESLMVSERREYLREEGLSGNKCNGYRPAGPTVTDEH